MDELIMALRCESVINDEHPRCESCKYGVVVCHGSREDVYGCDSRRIENAAADALEAADKRIDGLQKLVDINTERCEALRKQLRESHENYEKHINELEARLPKEGEWISCYDGFDYDVRCSVCGEEALIKEGGSHDHAYSHYCPNCGARMRGEQDEQ